MAQRKPRRSECCGVNFIKNVLLLFNVIFLITGVCILTIAVWTLWARHYYVSLMAEITYQAVTYALVAAGGVSIITAICGCNAAARRNRPLLLTYTFLLLVLFLTEVVVGIFSHMYAKYVSYELQSHLNNTFLENYYFDEVKTHAIDRIHQEYECCGARGFDDWDYSKWRKEILTKNLVPDSCCKTITKNCGVRNHPSNIYYTGCIHKLNEEIRNQMIILEAAGLGTCVVPLFGMIFSCTLFIKLRDAYD